MKTPMLFDFASSELAKETFICWLLSWASPEYKGTHASLHECAKKVIHTFFEKHKITSPTELKIVEVIKPDKDIDVLCIVNEEYPIIVKGKIATLVHKYQFEACLNESKSRMYDKDKILPVYFDTCDHGDYSAVKKEGYELFLRSELLSIMNEFQDIKNDIFTDYHQHLQCIENKSNSYLTLPLSAWNFNSWSGFFMELQKSCDGAWRLEYNPKDGEYFCFQFACFNDIAYLQLEANKLYFKIKVEDDNKSEKRLKWHSALINKADVLGIELLRPKKFGSGTYMTVCILKDDYRKTKDNQIIDMQKTLENINKAVSLVKSVKPDDVK
jgi:hypothetical protein